MKLLTGTLLSMVTILSIANAEMMTKEKKVINYTLSTDKPVDYEMTFSSPRDEKCEIRIDVHNENDANVMNAVHSMKKGKQVFNLPVKSGSYYLKLHVPNHIQSCNNKPFDFKLTKVSGHFEQEDNNNISNATDLIELKYFYGYLQTYYAYSDAKNDVDYYKIVLPSNGILDFEFSHKQTGSKSAFKIELLDAGNNVLTKYESSLQKKKSEKYFGLKKGTYYIKVSSNGNKDVRHLEYKIAYAVSKNNNIEMMPNNKFSDATLIKDGVYISGNFNQWQKDDYYKYQAKKGKYSLVYEHKPFDKDTDISIFDSNQHRIFSTRAKGLKEKEYFNFEVKEDGPIYVKLSHSFDYTKVDGDKYKFGILKGK